MLAAVQPAFKIFFINPEQHLWRQGAWLDNGELWAQLEDCRTRMILHAQLSLSTNVGSEFRRFARLPPTSSTSAAIWCGQASLENIPLFDFWNHLHENRLAVLLKLHFGTLAKIKTLWWQKTLQVYLIHFVLSRNSFWLHYSNTVMVIQKTHWSIDGGHFITYLLFLFCCLVRGKETEHKMASWQS